MGSQLNKPKNIRLLRVGRHKHNDIEIPTLTLAGKWLEQAGFTVDTQVAIVVGDGRLVMTALDGGDVAIVISPMDATDDK